ncbi:hypothetical protein EVG20_g7858 [Dentipellis fragilis]|uniref:Uncharacterized protein n=1 Tax=Dentipellis fragilis TaxID=205917 RepID=A0A4Y9YAK5_9AGAM|nr:hypothetical protein EVG20_g7858 [Dentipellis fragilis]
MIPQIRSPVSQSVKEVLQSLVDDGLVQTDKVGSSNCMLLFLCPMTAKADAYMRSNSLLELSVAARGDYAAREAQKANQQQLAELRASIEAERASRPESEGRMASLAKLVQHKKELQALETELQAYGACDPVKVEEKKRAVILAKEAAVRWTDNYLILLSHFTRQNGVEANDVRKYLGVGEDYEDIYPSSMQALCADVEAIRNSKSVAVASRQRLREAPDMLAGTPEFIKKTLTFTKWANHHRDVLYQAAICALNLGNCPENVATYLLVIQFEERPDAATRHSRDQFVPVDGSPTTFDNAKAMLRALGARRNHEDPALGLESNRMSHEEVKQNGGIGVATMLLILQDLGLSYVVSTALYRPEGARKAQQAEDWGEDWLERLAMALEYPILRRKFIKHHRPSLRHPPTVS